MITLSNISGSGSFEQDKVVSYSYSEDASPYEPSALEGGAGQVTVTVVADDSPRGTNISINNEIQLQDSEYGSVTFRARQVTMSEGSATISGETIQYKLDATRQAAAQGGSGTTLLEAILYYCGLVDIVPEFDGSLEEDLQDVEVNFPGWNGNVWEHLKMLCAAVSLSEEQNTFIEMYISGNTLRFRHGASTSVEFSEMLMDKTMSIDSYDAAQKVEVFNYNTSYGISKVFKEQRTDSNTFAINQNASIGDSMQVNAGETLVKRFKVNASLTSVEQPVVVSQITELPFPDTHSTGEYVVVGSDDFPIDPIQWLDQGGKLEVRLTENFDEVEILITAPPSVQMPKADGEPGEVTLAPYKIGVESSGGTEYPAIYLVGTGVFFEKTSATFVTGASEDYVADISATSIDNPFITTKAAQVNKGVAAAQAIMGPKIQVTGQLSTGLELGSSLGAKFEDYNSTFRLQNLSFDQSSISFTAKQFVTIDQFNTAWSGATLAQFNTVNAGISFDEFAVISLVRN